MDSPAENDPIQALHLLPGSVRGCHPWLLFYQLASQQAQTTAALWELSWRLSPLNLFMHALQEAVRSSAKP